MWDHAGQRCGGGAEHPAGGPHPDRDDGDGSEKSFTTQDTTSLPAMTEVLGTEHGGTGRRPR